MNHQLLEDHTSEERDPHNQEIIAFLKKTYQPVSQQVQPSEQTLLRLRQRLSSAIAREAEGKKRPQLHIIEGMGSGDRMPGEHSGMKRHLTLIAIAAVMLLVVGSSMFIFHSMDMSTQQSKVSSHKQAQPTSIPTKTSKEQAHILIDQLRREANTWGDAHLYQNPGDHKSYKLDNAYLEQGVLGQLEQQFQHAANETDYNQVIQQASDALFLLHAFEHESADKTVYDQAHQSDVSIMDHYQLQHKNVIVVSLAQQSLRVYEDGQQVKGFQATAGSINLPLPLGKHATVNRIQNVLLQSPYPQTSPLWYAPTHISYAIEFQVGGNMIFDAPWRTHFGPGSQFPLTREGKQPSGVQLAPADMQWLYEHTDTNTQIIVY